MTRAHSLTARAPPHLQLFAMPIFEEAEAALRGALHRPPRPVVLRLVLRSLYVVVITMVACAVPFFGDLM